MHPFTNTPYPSCGQHKNRGVSVDALIIEGRSLAIPN